ncbi:MAG: hypothetical protein ACTHU0_24995, partial [Kofleriaceae bacterium]
VGPIAAGAAIGAGVVAIGAVAAVAGSIAVGGGAAGGHASEQFGRVREHYSAIAESEIRRDRIPLTRRDFIQRYFEALRTPKEP